MLVVGKNANFDFGESCKSAFEEIKSILVTAPIMATPDLNKELESLCDAGTNHIKYIYWVHTDSEHIQK